MMDTSLIQGQIESDRAELERLSEERDRMYESIKGRGFSLEEYGRIDEIGSITTMLTQRIGKHKRQLAGSE